MSRPQFSRQHALTHAQQSKDEGLIKSAFVKRAGVGVFACALMAGAVAAASSPGKSIDRSLAQDNLAKTTSGLFERDQLDSRETESALASLGNGQLGNRQLGNVQRSNVRIPTPSLKARIGGGGTTRTMLSKFPDNLAHENLGHETLGDDHFSDQGFSDHDLRNQDRGYVRLPHDGPENLSIDAAKGATGEASSKPVSVRYDTYSGYPVPRFVSAKGKRTNCRKGPSLGHDIAYTFQRPGVPLLVIAESNDHWRKVRDAQGDECWVYSTTIRNPSHVLILETTTLHADRSHDATQRATLAPGVFARLGKTREDDEGREWVFLTTKQVRGWAVFDERLWGSDPLTAYVMR
ncbi:MAG: SH3 domain-containing protein [Pseudomonadota bacterium]